MMENNNIQTQLPKVKLPKTLLQELLQKNKIQLPKYETQPIRIDKKNMFHSTTKLFDNTFESKATSIKEAEQNCAKIAFEFLQQNHQELFVEKKKFRPIKKMNILNINFKKYKHIVFSDDELPNLTLSPLANYQTTLFLIFGNKNLADESLLEFENKNSNCYIIPMEINDKQMFLILTLGQLIILSRRDKVNFYLTFNDLKSFFDKFTKFVFCYSTIEQIFDEIVNQDKIWEEQRLIQEKKYQEKKLLDEQNKVNESDIPNQETLIQ